MSGAALFTWLQGADFYRDLHRAAVELLPHGEQLTWLDVGCGPGLLTRLAYDRGYRVRGIDRGDDMIAAAKRIARSTGSSVDFAVSDLAQEMASGRIYDVVSASSLLVVLPDRDAGLAQLEALVKPGDRSSLSRPRRR